MGDILVGQDASVCICDQHTHTYMGWKGGQMEGLMTYQILTWKMLYILKITTTHKNTSETRAMPLFGCCLGVSPTCSCAEIEFLLRGVKKVEI